jgi:hypothetical protein
VTWEELPHVETEDFTLVTMQKRFAKLGDVQSSIDGTVCDLGVLLEWVEREVAAGVGEAPYPPNFPRAAAGAAVACQEGRVAPRDRRWGARRRCCKASA